jgi:predicted nuclease of restriction endonuclease-like (RecB) superfamily
MKNEITNNNITQLFDKVVKILEQAKSNVIQAVNSNMVLAYWLIGKEIVNEFQAGKERAEYGMNLLQDLSDKLTMKYGKGYSVPNLQNFRKFYLAFADRFEIQYLPGTISEREQIQYPLGTISKNPFNSNLSWSHYRALMRVKNTEARNYYEKEAAECGWNKRELERHIHSQHFERMLKNQDSKANMINKKSLLKTNTNNIDILKNPYILEFLELNDLPNLYENQLEKAIINHLQSFLLELGRGFAFLARQKRLQYENQDYYVDLVFYNCILKCYLLIDLKIGELTHQDVGQMDGYVRLFDDLYTAEDDNPTIGLILCADKNEAIAKYSVLNERKQIFASKYMLYLPSEEELQSEIIRERKLLEQNMDYQTENNRNADEID